MAGEVEEGGVGSAVVGAAGASGFGVGVGLG